MAMHWIIFQHPIAEVQRAIGGDRHTGRSKVRIALDDDLTCGAVRSSTWNKLVALDAVVTPARYPKRAPMRNQRRRRFTNTDDVRKRPRQFAIPCLQRMRARPAVLIAKA